MYIPECFRHHKPVVIRRDSLPEEFHDLFVWDGGAGNWGRMRSIWFDNEERRGRSKIDIAQNILRIPQASSEQFFDYEVLQKIRAKYLRKPNYKGKIQFENIGGVFHNIKFLPKESGNVLKWWGSLPNKTHNYIVACDISRGTGASNSVLTICDVNKHELVGIYADPYIDVPDFAEMAVATCKWLGDAYLIWEANGPGDTFDKTVWKLGYNKVYFNVNERKMVRKRGLNRGWRSTPGPNGSKMMLLDRLDSALAESLKPERYYNYLVIHDEALLNELEDYIFIPGRIDAGLSNSVLDESGARYAHGDRVIATGLCVLAMVEVRPADLRREKEPPPESFEARFRKWQAEQENIKRTMRRFRY